MAVRPVVQQKYDEIVAAGGVPSFYHWQPDILCDCHIYDLVNLSDPRNRGQRIGMTREEGLWVVAKATSDGLMNPVGYDPTAEPPEVQCPDHAGLADMSEVRSVAQVESDALMNAAIGLGTVEEKFVVMAEVREPVPVQTNGIVQFPQSKIVNTGLFDEREVQWRFSGRDGARVLELTLMDRTLDRPTYQAVVDDAVGSGKAVIK